MKPIINIVTIYDAKLLCKVDQTDWFIKCGPYTSVVVKYNGDDAVFGSYEYDRGEQSAYQYAKWLSQNHQLFYNKPIEIKWSTEIIR